MTAELLRSNKHAVWLVTRQDGKAKKIVTSISPSDGRRFALQIRGELHLFQKEDFT